MYFDTKVGQLSSLKTCETHQLKMILTVPMPASRTSTGIEIQAKELTEYEYLKPGAFLNTFT